MKLVSILLSFSACAFAQDFSYLPAPPVVKLSARTTEPLIMKLVRDAETQEMIRVTAEKHQVSAAFVRSIVAAESNFNVDAISPKGAIGLMQLMPATAEQFGADPHVPSENLDAGTQYLKSLIAKYQGYKNGLSRAIAAYNAGPGAVDRYKGIPPFPETRGYVAKVLGLLRQFQSERH